MFRKCEKRPSKLPKVYGDIFKSLVLTDQQSKTQKMLINFTSQSTNQRIVSALEFKMKLD